MGLVLVVGKVKVSPASGSSALHSVGRALGGSRLVVVLPSITSFVPTFIQLRAKAFFFCVHWLRTQNETLSPSLADPGLMYVCIHILYVRNIQL